MIKDINPTKLTRINEIAAERRGSSNSQPDMQRGLDLSLNYSSVTAIPGTQSPASKGLQAFKKKGLNVTVGDGDFEEEKRPHTTKNFGSKRNEKKSLTFHAPSP
mmetsp:Transcript_27959/g.24631  ORF Transcript_27959/g.24631 Transcript_27959/m.24631 type:complete len:104 (-) Transcript_27959:1140-1451(-)